MNKIMGLVTASILVVIFLGSVTVPLINGYTATTETFENDAAFYMTNEAPYEIAYDFDTNVCTVNGDTVTLDSTDEYSLVFSDEFALRNYGGDLYRPILLADLTSTNTSNYTKSVSIDENLHATVTRLVSGVEVVSEFDLEYFYGIVAEKTEYAMSTGDDVIYVNADSQIFTTGRTNVNNWSNTFEVSGSIENGAAATVIRPPTGISVSDAELNYSQVPNHSGYAITSITFNATIDDTSEVTEVTYNRLVVPSEVTMDITVPLFDDVERGLIIVIPLLLICAFVCAFAYVVFRRDY